MSSREGSSTLYASAATTASAPWATKACSASVTCSGVSPLPVSRKVWSGWRTFPWASGMGSIWVWFRARAPSRPLPMPTIPTGTTSPSRRALVAWVVPWEMKTTSAGSMPPRSNTPCTA